MAARGLGTLMHLILARAVGQVMTPRRGAGHSGTRIFAREHLPRIKYQNPQAEVSLRADNYGEGWKRSQVVIELQSGTLVAVSDTSI